jgi:hypothetical protein
MSESENIAPTTLVLERGDSSVRQGSDLVRGDSSTGDVADSQVGTAKLGGVSPLDKHKKFPLILLLLIPILVTIAVISIYILLQVRTMYQQDVVSSPSPTSSSESLVKQDPTNVIIPDGLSGDGGIVSGKLCYPSDFLPPGEIVAKNIETGKIIEQKYAGSNTDVAFSLSLPKGNYHLRYQAHGAEGQDSYISGYYTNCLDSKLFDTCTPSDPRDHMIVKVENSQVVSGAMLCDFSFGEKLEQSF